MKTYFVYIIASKTGTIYTGMTNDLERRVYEHKAKKSAGFTSKYDVTRLVYYEETQNVDSAIEREKQIKSWRRSKKVDLITSTNPKWEDLSKDWFEDELGL